jgi:hypothetical protein
MLKILFEEKQPSLFGWSITDEEITLQRKVKVIKLLYLCLSKGQIKLECLSPASLFVANSGAYPGGAHFKGTLPRWAAAFSSKY